MTSRRKLGTADAPETELPSEESAASTAFEPNIRPANNSNNVDFTIKMLSLAFLHSDMASALLFQPRVNPQLPRASPQVNHFTIDGELHIALEIVHETQQSLIACLKLYGNLS